jgi:heme/copper-type cytochrome/quinol oxidase subunit 2
MSWFFNSNVINQSQILTQFTGTNSGLLAPSRNYIRSVNTLSAYTYFISNLIDIMTKREYMLKQLLNYYNVNASFNNSYVTSPYNTILIDFKANFLSNYFTEAKLSEITHYNTNQFILKTLVYNIKLNYFIKNLASTLTKNSFINKFIISFTDIQSGNYTFDRNLTIFKKTQYKHMRKSMSNMIRIQNDKAVAMPVDTRIQFLTVSKDIIHS